MTAAAPLGEITPRQAFNELLRRKVDGLIGPVIASGPVGQGPQSQRVADARLAESQSRAFADAVDDLGPTIPYGDAVVILGSTGPIVTTGREFDATPAYWLTMAGEDTAVVDGADLMHWLHSD